MKSEGHHGGDSDGAGGAAPAAPFRSSLRGVVSGSQTGADRAALRTDGVGDNFDGDAIRDADELLVGRRARLAVGRGGCLNIWGKEETAVKRAEAG